MAPLLSANLRETVNSAAYLTTSDNTHKPLRINIRQCQLLAKKASETLFELDNFSVFLQLQDSLNDSKDTAWTPAVDGLCRVLENAKMLIEDCCGDHWLENCRTAADKPRSHCVWPWRRKCYCKPCV
ncbi:hypothetical protein KC19_VG287100 [Ceratodon purpureus]|uniref:Uncharacterized protein n=1 Tax=Ceratodon purpureus TaxID=3225 RepID=A0A8T0HW87_CERPU|nr:hypothetical protein KC19_VG287100 [Ceratodon purpureus]